MGKTKAKLRSKAKQPFSVDAEVDQRTARLRSMGYRTFDELAVDVPAAQLGVIMMRNRGLLDWELDFLVTRCVHGTGKALIPVKRHEDGLVEVYHARVGFWKPTGKALERLCFPIPGDDLNRMLEALSPDGARMLRTIHDFQAQRVRDLVTPAYKLAETRSPYALDLLHTGGLRNGSASMTPEEACRFADIAERDFAHMNSETFESVSAAKRVRDYFVKCVETGRVRAALDRGDVVVTPHFSRFNLATHSGDFCKECLHELEYDKDMPVNAMLSVIAFLQSVGEFWGPFYNTDADILPTPVDGPPGCGFLAEPGATTVTEEDLVPFLRNARRTLMAAVATPGRLKWNVGPAASVFANVSVWAGADHVCKNARLVLCPINGPPCSRSAWFTRDLEAFSEELPPKCRGRVSWEQYSAYREFWSHEADWVYERPRLRIAFEFNKASFEFGNAKEWAPPEPRVVRHPGGGCHATPPPPAPPKPAPVAPDETEWFQLLCKGVAREMCDGIVDTVLRRVRAPSRRSAAERRAEWRAEAVEVHARAPGGAAAHHRLPRVVVRAAAVAPEGSVEDSKKKTAREAHLAKLAEQAKAKTEARKRADDARFEQMRNELVGAAIGGW